MMEETRNATIKFMKSKHAHDTTGHDIAHVLRVRQMALKLADYYPESQHDIIEIAALLHDTVDDKLVDRDAAYIELKQFLNEQNIELEKQQEILYIIDYISFRKSKLSGRLKTIEAQIVQDADRLDAIGAIGIARTFQYAGHFGEPMWTGELSLEQMRTLEDIDNLPPSAVKHFYKKLLKLKDLMNTLPAKKIAEERHAFLELYLQHFFAEWQIEK
ncbi:MULTISPECIES: HD domain-containing protein [Staphylococcus]|uniref:HD domain-containing protein n=1 Tax=Staphylococcus schleiferi TaxID=1295 RepID=A0A7Z7VWN9_STASC|nr:MULTISPECIES: HD domain-containing protein [Staphylococcus]QGS45911.1 HD domain-containing protein [Mammaliicoccus fleurettii]EPD47860.1 hypothetical protein HMPREF1208_02279 [Staphylococcus sp. HGB0015]MBF1992964.1 HD domain-containing protein [Staphylococcus schleiferi]MBF2038436.1 HD domain-containing protein [Staphylococcus schleiferi]MBF2100353.1 HD domain-containing protein [Staphylococcus schleiferi]